MILTVEEETCGRLPRAAPVWHRALAADRGRLHFHLLSKSDQAYGMLLGSRSVNLIALRSRGSYVRLKIMNVSARHVFRLRSARRGRGAGQLAPSPSLEDICEPLA